MAEITLNVKILECDYLLLYAMNKETYLISNSIVVAKKGYFNKISKKSYALPEIWYVLYFTIEWTTWNSNSKMKLLDQNIQMCSPVLNYVHTKTMKIWFAANSRKKELNYHSQKQNGEHVLKWIIDWIIIKEQIYPVPYRK